MSEEHENHWVDASGEEDHAQKYREGDGNISLAGHQVLDHVAIRAAERVNALIRAREDKRYRTLVIVLTIAGAVGAFILGALADRFVDDAIADRIGDIDTVSARIDRMLSYQFFVATVVGMESNEEGWNETQRDIVLEYLPPLASDTSLTNTLAFAAMTEKVVDKFHAAGLSGAVDKLDSLISPTLLNHRGSVYTMVIHYGQRVVGEPSVDSATLARYGQYDRAAKAHELDFLAYFWELLYEFKTTNEVPSEKTSQIARYGLGLAEADRFVALLLEYADTDNWVAADPPMPFAVEIERIVRDVVRSHPVLDSAFRAIDSTYDQNW